MQQADILSIVSNLCSTSVLVTCKYKDCYYYGWSSWSATCGSVERSRRFYYSRDRSVEVKESKDCDKYTKTCEQYKKESKTLSKCPGNAKGEFFWLFLGNARVAKFQMRLTILIFLPYSCDQNEALFNFIVLLSSCMSTQELLLLWLGFMVCNMRFSFPFPKTLLHTWYNHLCQRKHGL